MASKPDLGLIGVGNVGTYFVQWLTDAGYDLTVYDIDYERVAAAVEQGANAGESAADVTSKASIILLALPGNQYVETVMEGENGVLETLSGGQLVVDTGTTSPDVVEHYSKLCDSRGAGYMDSPLTWSGPGSYTDENGPAYTMFTGGQPEQYERVKPIIEELSYSHSFFEGTANGMVVKAAHRMRQVTETVMNAEFVAFLENNDIDSKQVDGLLDINLSDQFFAEEPPGEPIGAGKTSEKGYRLEPMAARTSLRIPHWTKDPQYARAIARSSNTTVPMLSAALSMLDSTEQYARARSNRDIVFQDPDWDHEDVIHQYRRLNSPGMEQKRRNRTEAQTK